jgi:TPR repeat protein
MERTLKTLSISVLTAGLTFLTLMTARAAIADFETAVAAVSVGDYMTARREFESLAERGDPRGQNGLGVLYIQGWGVERDLAKAVDLFRQAAKHGLRAAENNLGEMYMQGAGVEQDYAEAYKWYLKAAQKGDDEAQNNLGVLYVGGFGVEQDFAAAMEWFQKSAKQGNVEAQANVGHLFRTGDGVARDYLLAYAWYGIAAAGGLNMGPQLRDSVLTFLNDDEVEQARAIARELYLKYARNRPNP